MLFNEPGEEPASLRLGRDLLPFVNRQEVMATEVSLSSLEENQHSPTEQPLAPQNAKQSDESLRLSFLVSLSQITIDTGNNPRLYLIIKRGDS